jgi:hypothetical protein
VRVLSFRSAMPLFGRVLHHSSVPTNDRAGVARSGGPGRPRGRRETALPWTGEGTAARLRLFESSPRAVVPLFVALTVSNATAIAEMRPAEPTANYRTSDPFADFVKETSRRFGISVRWIRAVIDVENAGDVRARSPKGAMGLMQIMQRRGQSYVCGTISATIPTILMTTFLRVLRTFVNCAPGTVHRASLQPTTLDPLDTKSVSPAARCR